MAGSGWWYFVAFGDDPDDTGIGPVAYGMNLRDVVPFEDRLGLLSLPLPPRP